MSDFELEGVKMTDLQDPLRDLFWQEQQRQDKKPRDETASDDDQTGHFDPKQEQEQGSLRNKCLYKLKFF